MTSQLTPGLGELLRHLTELVDQGAENAYSRWTTDYRPRYTPIMRSLADGDCSVTDITNRLAITQGAVSQSIKLMMVDGLVKRASGVDARQSIISLTRKGERLLKNLQLHWEATFGAIQGLENEINIPLRHDLVKAIKAFETLGFSDRIALYEKPNLEDRKSSTRSMGYDKANHFKQGGESYALHRPTYPPELADALSQLCGSRELAIDVGCGSGQLSTQLASYFDQVVATDINQGQLDHSEKRANLSYRCEPAEVMSIEGGSVDLIVAAQSAHWFDLKQFYRECIRVAKPDTVIALVSYGVPYLEDALNARFQKFYWQEVAEFWPAERLHVETGYSELPFPFTSLPSPRLFIHRDWDLLALQGYIETWSATRCANQKGRAEVLSGFYKEIITLWGDIGTIRRMTWPIAIRVGRIK